MQGLGAGLLAGGSGFVRLVKAGLFGTIAAALSAAGWYGIVKLTGYELGIVAVVVGLVVVGAVRMGSEQRGGWLYQMLAVLLTYLAIATSYVPTLMESAREDAKQVAEPASEDPVFPNAAAPAAEAEANAVAEMDPTLVLVLAVVFSLAMPVLQVTEGGFIGLLIVGFALYEAWKINKRQWIEFSGPFQLQRSPGTSPA